MRRVCSGTPSLGGSPVGIASVEWLFSEMKLIKSRLCSRKIAIEGPQLTDVDFVDFDGILDIFKQKNRRILL